MKDTHLIYLILSKIFDEYNEIKLLNKIVDLSNRSDDEIKDFLSRIKVEDKKWVLVLWLEKR